MFLPRKFRLTWQPGTDGRSGRWKTIYRGQTHYLGMAPLKSDVPAYKVAFARWLEEKARLDAEQAKQPKPFLAEYELAISE